MSTLPNIHNFGPGPSHIPKVVIDKTIDAIKNFSNGLSLLEISHRSLEWKNFMNETKELMKEVLSIPEGYEILFLGGGASLQFVMVAMNLLQTKAAYLDTGVWSSKAIKEAQSIGEVEIVATSKDKNYSYIPEFTIPTDCDYFHITTNNTIYGTEMKEDIDSPIPLVADMSSDLFSRPIDISKYSLIYASAQKNCGIAGVTIVIVKNSVLGKVKRKLPSMLDYQVHIKNESMYNTPPVISIFTVNQTVKYIKEIGGVSALKKLNEEKAELLYKELERNELFTPTARKENRSMMNICFIMSKGYEKLEEDFIQFANQHNIVGIRGYRGVGGFRVSCYNAIRIESVRVLIGCMQEFEKLNITSCENK